MKRIILASTSPRRREILENAGIPFEVIPGNYEEDMTLDLQPDELVKLLAKGKAHDVAKNLNEGIIIGADTFVMIDGKKMGKPKSENDAQNMLKYLSGNHSSVFTGMCVIDLESGKEYCESTEIKVKFREITDEEINWYISTGEPMDKAGAYALQGKASLFIEGIEGDYWALVGLPICRLGVILGELGVELR